MTDILITSSSGSSEGNLNLTNMCPVCAYSLDCAPADFNICPSCGTEFGADTATWTVEELRDAWIARGLPWTSSVIPMPDGWDAKSQLSRIGKLSNYITEGKWIRKFRHHSV